ncbi:hypothetical protein O1M54_21705 [Streptomyces diastatochromogenes]|nr:hypothetical protein [Streptomyces diastatochromogenes]
MTVAVPTTLAPAAPRTRVRGVTAVRHLARGGLLSLAALLLGITAQLLLLSGVQQHSAQHAAFDELREQLALGTAPWPRPTSRASCWRRAHRSRSSTYRVSA